MRVACFFLHHLPVEVCLQLQPITPLVATEKGFRMLNLRSAAETCCILQLQSEIPESLIPNPSFPNP